MADLRYLWVNLVMIGFAVILVVLDHRNGLIWLALMVALAFVRWRRWRTWPKRVRR